MNIRPIESEDIPLLTSFWYDQMALLSQKQSAFRLMPDAAKQWQEYAGSLLQSDDMICYVAELDNVVGCLIGHVAQNEVGLLPQHYGCIDYLILDLHSRLKPKRTVKGLLDAFRQQLKQKNIAHLLVRVSTYSPVEQGFWRGLGLTHIQDTFWMDL